MYSIYDPAVAVSVYYDWINYDRDNAQLKYECHVIGREEDINQLESMLGSNVKDIIGA